MAVLCNNSLRIKIINHTIKQGRPMTVKAES